MSEGDGVFSSDNESGKKYNLQGHDVIIAVLNDNKQHGQ